MLPTQRVRMVAGTPITVGERRLLPSVLVTTMEGGDATSGSFSYVKVRPISIVEEGADGARWLEIPNATMNVITVMAAVGLGIAVVSTAIIVLARLVRGR